jgi:hypothetical protein
MRKIGFLMVLVVAFTSASAQKIEGIYFNLYTDSLKKGFYNYISIDAKYADGQWQPLDSTQIIFTANTGHFKGNDLFIDSSYTGDTVKVKATLKSNPAIWKETTIYIRKRGFDEPLKTNEEILNEMRNGRKKPKQRSA